MRTLNLGILAHVDAGKTTLTERLLHTVGVIDEVGSVDKGTTQTDSLALERQRGITIRSAVVSFVLNDISVNLIDTPGHPDFIAEVERVLSVLDGAVLVISAVEGVQSQTRILMRTLQRLQIPTLIFVNKIDRQGARYEGVLSDIADRLTPSIVAMGEIQDAGTRSADFVAFNANDSPFVDRLAELLADYDDEMLSAYVADEGFSFDDLYRQLAHQTRSVRTHPVYFGAAVTGKGVPELMSGISGLLPAVQGDAEGPVSGAVFKVERGQSGEKVAYLSMFSGMLRTRDMIEVRGRPSQRITAIRVFENGSDTQSAIVSAGQIAKIWGLSDIQIGDAIGAPRRSGMSPQFTQPTLETAVVPVHPEEKGALFTALSQLSEQDPLINLRQDDVRQELYVSLNGEVQKEVIQQTLADEFNVQVEFRDTTTICIERPLKPGVAVEEIGKAPNPFLATVGLRIEPAAIGTGVEFRLEVDTGSIPMFVYGSAEEFGKAIETVVREALQQGLNGWQVTDSIVTMTHSGYTSPATGARDFRYLTPLVLMNALKIADTEVCEPFHRFQLEGPADMLAPMLSELARLQAVPRLTTTHGSLYSIEGDIAAARVHELQTRLRALSRGEGILESAFDHYEPVTGPPPSRPRTDNNPLDYKEYLLHVTRGI